MEFMWPFILSSIAGLSTIIGSISIFLRVKDSNRFIAFSLSFSLAVMLGVSIFDLIPSALLYLNPNRVFVSILVFILSFLLGSLLVRFLNRLIEKKSQDGLYNLGFLSFITLVLHNFPEGILTFLSTYHDFKLGLSLTLAIALHNIPEGISIAIPIYYSTNSKWQALKTTILSGIAEPLGALVAFAILKRFITDEMVSVFLVFVAGIMVTLSIEKMLPEAECYGNKKTLYLGFISGLIVVIVSVFLL